MIDAEALEHGSQEGLDTLLVHALNYERRYVKIVYKVVAPPADYERKLKMQTL